MLDFGSKLKLLREKYGLSQDQLATRLGYGASTISQYEKGRREPDFKRLREIKEYFNVDYNFLLEDKKNDKEVIKRIELDIVNIIEVLEKNYVTIEGRKMSEEAKEGLISFLKGVYKYVSYSEDRG